MTESNSNNLFRLNPDKTIDQDHFESRIEIKITTKGCNLV